VTVQGDAGFYGREGAADDGAPRIVRDLGVMIHGGQAVVLLAAGSRAPCARAMTFTTITDGQRAIEIRVVRCGPRAAPDGEVGRFLLPGLRGGPRGEARIDIGLSLDHAGILRAWGADRSTGARQEACFAGAWALDPAARPAALAALMRRMDAELSPGGALSRERDQIAWTLAEGPDTRSATDCGLALATLAGEAESQSRAAGGSAVPVRFSVRAPLGPSGSRR
jgi:hypothetical protein